MMDSCEIFCVGNAVADILARPVDHLGPLLDEPSG
jgi:hypothetical protein